jgi:hypothetical protein
MKEDASGRSDDRRKLPVDQVLLVDEIKLKASDRSGEKESFRPIR